MYEYFPCKNNKLIVVTLCKLFVYILRTFEYRDVVGFKSFGEAKKKIVVFRIMEQQRGV